MHNSLWKCSFIAPAICSIVLFFCGPSWCADWEVSLDLGVIEEYNDNVLFSSKEREIDDFVTYVTPEIEAKYATERFRVSLASGLGAEKYIDNSDLDTIDLDERLALSYAVSRTLTLEAGGYFLKDTTQESELTEEGLMLDREDRRKFGGNLGFDYAFSTRLSLSGGWTRRYTEYPDLHANYDDRRGDTFGLVPRYNLSPRTTLSINMFYTNTEYDEHYSETDTSIANFSIQPSFRYYLAEDSYVFGGAGYRYTKGETDEGSDTAGGFIYHLAVHKDWRTWSLELLGSIDQYSTVDRESMETHRLTLRGTYRFTDRFRASAAATYRRNLQDKGHDDNDYFTVSPALSYDLTPSISLRGSVVYSKYYYEGGSNQDDRDRFMARVGIDFRWPRLWSS